MLSVLRHRTYRHLFAAQALSLIGTGLTTVALGLLAYEVAGEDAGAVLGTALALKMIAYVGIAPIVGAFAGHLPRRAFLVALDLCRAVLVLLLPFVTEIWQVYVLVFAFQSFSAAFTPTFQATIPDVLADERDYTKALSLSRLAYDLEALLSPTLAAALLVGMSFHWLFAGTTIGFLASAALIVSVALPAAKPAGIEGGVYARMTRGIRIYLATPRLRGLLALNLAVAAAGSMVIVNTVVYVREILGGTDRDVALFFMASGVGSIFVALSLPRLLNRLAERPVMIAGATLLTAALVLALLDPSYGAALGLWTLIGAGSSLVQTPSGRLLRRSSRAKDRPALFAAQFALSHACWLITYPAAGWLGAGLGLSTAFLVLAVTAAVGGSLALFLWPAQDPEVLEHEHATVAHEHAHVHDEHHAHTHSAHVGQGQHRHRHVHAPLRHAHAFVIDDHHRRWPNPATSQSA